MLLRSCKPERIKPRHPVAITHCPNCLADRLKITASYIAYLESGKLSPSAPVIGRYWKFVPR